MNRYIIRSTYSTHPCTTVIIANCNQLIANCRLIIARPNPHSHYKNCSMSHQTPGIKHLFPNTQIMQFQCDDIWRRVDQLDFRFGDELTSPPRRRVDQGDELTCNPRIAVLEGFKSAVNMYHYQLYRGYIINMIN